MSYKNLFLIIFLLFSQKFSAQESSEPIFHDEEGNVKFEDLEITVNDIAQKVAQSIPQEEINELVMHIKEILEDFVKEQDIENHIANNAQIVNRSGQLATSPEDTLKLQENIQKAITDKMLSFLTPEYMQNIAKLMAEKYQQDLQNKTTLQKVISAISETSIVKTVTYRILASALTLISTYKYLQIAFVTALSFGAIDLAAKVALYYAHEKAWDPKIKKCIVKYCSCCKKHK